MNNENLIMIDLFCVYHGIEVAFITALQDYNLIEIIVIEEKQYFPIHALSSVEKMIRLYHELNINLEGIDVIMSLLNKIDSLQNQLLLAQNRIIFFEKN
ncbi:MAG: chaperone modulator CbpM [Flavobacterium sp.]|nr:chaperone modulator CbpM [Flavobacterium sp.]